MFGKIVRVILLSCSVHIAVMLAHPLTKGVIHARVVEVEMPNLEQHLGTGFKFRVMLFDPVS